MVVWVVSVLKEVNILLSIIMCLMGGKLVILFNKIRIWRLKIRRDWLIGCIKLIFIRKGRKRRDYLRRKGLSNKWSSVLLDPQLPMLLLADWSAITTQFRIRVSKDIKKPLIEWSWATKRTENSSRWLN